MPESKQPALATTPSASAPKAAREVLPKRVIEKSESYQPGGRLIRLEAPPGLSALQTSADDRGYFLQVSSPIGMKPLPMSTSSLWKPSLPPDFIPIVSRVFIFMPIIRLSPV